MFSLKRLLVFIIFMGFTVMSTAKIKLFTSTYPTLYGEPLRQLMWMENGREYFLLNVNSGDSLTSGFVNGIGLVEGSLNKEESKDYENIKNRIFLVNRKNAERYKKGIKSKKLNVSSSFENKESNSFILYSQKTEEEKYLVEWFNSKVKSFKDNGKYELKTGFLINTLVEPKGDFYSVKLFFENISNKRVVLTGVDQWKDVNGDKRISTEVVLKIQSDWNLFKFNLLNRYFVKNNLIDLEKIVIEPKGLKELEFLIPKNEFLSFNQFREKNKELKFNYSLIVNLKIYEPSEISGGFSYSTKSILFE